ncbi:MAG: metallophosphoesterase family protein [Rhodomicrobium sp.]|jgi:putative phosphoesterase
MTIIGLISDTHGLLRREVAAALAGVSQILHAGDVGRPEVLDELRAIAPVTAVRGNVDGGRLAEALPMDAVVSIGGADIYMLHNLSGMDIDPKAAGIAAVVSGHTHAPLIEMLDGVLYVNPGSAGPRRFSLPISVGFLRVSRDAPIEAWVRTLDAGG